MKHYTNTGTKNTIRRCRELDVGLMIVSPHRFPIPEQLETYGLNRPPMSYQYLEAVHG